MNKKAFEFYKGRWTSSWSSGCISSIHMIQSTPSCNPPGLNSLVRGVAASVSFLSHPPLKAGICAWHATSAFTSERQQSLFTWSEEVACQEKVKSFYSDLCSFNKRPMLSFTWCCHGLFYLVSPFKMCFWLQLFSVQIHFLLYCLLYTRGYLFSRKNKVTSEYLHFRSFSNFILSNL